MSDLGFLLLFVAIALAVAWLVNSLVAILSGEHPRDTQGVWLDIVLGELRGDSVQSFAPLVVRGSGGRLLLSSALPYLRCCSSAFTQSKAGRCAVG
jgi:hypothetical protein